MFGMLSVLAELQRELIATNTRKGWLPPVPAAAPAGAGPASRESRPPWLSGLYDAREKTVQQIADLFGSPAPPYTATSPERRRGTSRPVVGDEKLRCLRQVGPGRPPGRGAANGAAACPAGTTE